MHTMRKSMLCASAVVGATTALLLVVPGVAQAGEFDYPDIPVENYPECGEALVKVGVSTAAGAVGGPAGAVAGAATGLPDVYYDCPPLHPIHQNGT